MKKLPKVRSCTSESIAEWRKLTTEPASKQSVIACGGFSGSPYLQKRLQQQIDRLNNKYNPEHPILFEVAGEYYK